MGAGLSQQTQDRLYTCKKNGGSDLNLSNCELQKIPSVTWKFKQLRTLNASRNMLQALPPEIKLLPLLEELDASTNEVSDIAAEIRALDRLTNLDLSNNTISSLSLLPKSLKVLKISFNSITTSGELDLPSITELYYGHNKVTIFPPQILSFKFITVLDISGNRLTYLPDEISNLTTLQHLDLSGNQFNAVPVSISLLTNLHVLNIGGNLEFPKSFCNGLECLKNLKLLDVAMCALTTLPRQVGYIPHLRKLLANNNNIKTLPGELSLLNPATDMSFSSNPLEYPYSQYVSEGVPTLLEHLPPFMRGTYVIMKYNNILISLCPRMCN